MAVITTQNYSRVEGEQPKPAAPPAPKPDAIKKPAPEAIKKPAPEAINKPDPEYSNIHRRLVEIKQKFKQDGDIARELDGIIHELMFLSTH